MKRILKEARVIINEFEHIEHLLVTKIFRFKYPKLVFFVLCIILAYLIFRNPSVSLPLSKLQNLSYLGIFIAGIMFTFGFTTPFAIGAFIVLNPSNIYLAAVVGGLGALLGDLTIFKIIRISFQREFNLLKNEKPFKRVSDLIHNHIKLKFYNYFLFIFAGIIIASPLPDELGVAMLAGLTKIHPRIFALLSFLFNSLGILVMLLIG